MCQRHNFLKAIDCDRFREVYKQAISAFLLCLHVMLHLYYYVSSLVVITASSVPIAKFSCSLDDNIEELVPVRRLKAGKAHGKTLDFLYYVVFYVKVINPTFV